MAHRFRFGYQLGAVDLVDPVAAARRAEAAGFDIVLVADHVGGAGPAPMVVLGAMAEATDRIRLGTFVVNHDMRNPVQLAWEAATLDRLSDGRFDLGLGAGHTPQEYAATGVAFDPPAVRKARLCEGVEVIRRLLDGETVTHHGEHVHIEAAAIGSSAQARVPLLVGGNGSALLAHAGAWADIVGLQGLGRTGPDGHAHTVRWDPAWLDVQVEQIRAGAGGRFDRLELNALVQTVRLTDDAGSAIAEICAGLDGLTPADAAEIPYLMIGTVDEIADKLRRCRDRWGITYFAVRDLAFSEVIGRLGRG